MLWSWAKRRHPNKSLKWINERYFKSNDTRNCIFKTDKATLKKMSDTPIRRHTKIRGDANPFDQEQELYFEKRWTQSWEKEPVKKKRTLWKLQKGKCPICKQRLFQKDELNIHHRQMKLKGGKDNLYNLVLLHDTCHRQLHATKQEHLLIK